MSTCLSVSEFGHFPWFLERFCTFRSAYARNRNWKGRINYRYKAGQQRFPEPWIVTSDTVNSVRHRRIQLYYPAHFWYNGCNRKISFISYRSQWKEKDMKEKKNSTIREIHDQGAKAVFEDPILCAEFFVQGKCPPLWAKRVWAFPLVFRKILHV